MTWRVITMIVAGMLAVGAAREATRPGKLEEERWF